MRCVRGFGIGVRLSGAFTRRGARGAFRATRLRRVRVSTGFARARCVFAAFGVHSRFGGRGGRGARLRLFDLRQTLRERSSLCGTRTRVSDESRLQLLNCGQEGADSGIDGRWVRGIGVRGGAIDRAVRGRRGRGAVGSPTCGPPRATRRGSQSRRGLARARRRS